MHLASDAAIVKPLLRSVTNWQSRVASVSAVTGFPRSIAIDSSTHAVRVRGLLRATGTAPRPATPTSEQ